MSDTTADLAVTGPPPACIGAGAVAREDLSACTKVPPERISEFLDWPPARLHRETRQVGRILVRFAKAVLDSMASSSAGDEFVRSLDLASISRDHDWRVIFSTIRDAPGTDVHFRHQALVKYLQYLGFRKRLLEFIHARRQGLEETANYSGLHYHATTTLGLPEREAGAGERFLAGDGRAYTRLPLGETVDLHLARQPTYKLVLAGYVLYLHGMRPPMLRDKQGRRYGLRRGRNVVGRHPESDIELDASLSGVSRAHLVLAWDGAERVSVTDLSSTGTLLRVD